LVPSRSSIESSAACYLPTSRAVADKRRRKAWRAYLVEEKPTRLRLPPREAVRG
jgi:hypothetical protein